MFFKRTYSIYLIESIIWTFEISNLSTLLYLPDKEGASEPRSYEFAQCPLSCGLLSGSNDSTEVALLPPSK